MSGSRLGKFISKANTIANQVGQEYQKAKEQYQQHQSQQQQGYNGQQYGGQQQQAGGWPQPQGTSFQSPSMSAPPQQQGYQGYHQSPAPPQQPQSQQYSGPHQHHAVPQHQSPQQSGSPMHPPPSGGFPPPPGSQGYQPPPPPSTAPFQPSIQQGAYTSATPASAAQPLSPQRYQDQFASELQAAEKLAAEYKAKLDLEMAAANVEADRLRKEQDEQLKLAERELARYKKEQDEQLKLAEREMERLKEEQDAAVREAEKEMEKMRIQADNPSTSPRPASSVGGTQTNEAHQQTYYPPPPPGGPPPETGTVSYAYPPPPPGAATVPAPSPPVSASAPPDQGAASYSCPPPPPPPQSGQHTTAASIPAQGTISYAYPPPPPQAQQQPSYPQGPTSASATTQPASTPSSVPGPTPPAYEAQKQQAYPQPVQPQPQFRYLKQWTSEPPRSNTPPIAQMHPCGTAPITDCVGEPMPLELDWFTHPSAPDFLICSKCYVDKIFNTQFRSAFQLVHHSSSPPRYCNFATPRIELSLWPTALASSDLTTLVQFMQKRQQIPACTGESFEKDKNWYTSPELPNATICPACHEDYLLSCSFGTHFTLSRSDGYCDMSTMYIKRMHEFHSVRADWAGFVVQMNARLGIQPCPKSAPQPPQGQHTWYRATRGPDGMFICAACYCDFFYNTPDQVHWQQAVPTLPETRCLLGNVNVRLAVDKAMQDKNHGIFWRAMEEGDKHEFCNPFGIANGKWYTLAGGQATDDFLICGACYETVVYAWGGTRWFAPKSAGFFGGGSKKGETRVCAFSPGHQRYTRNLVAYLESTLRGAPQPLADLARVYAGVAPCPRSKQGKSKSGARWWGWDNCMICEECYLDFAKGTSLERQFSYRGSPGQQGALCDVYSARMRQLYTEACASGDLQALLRFAAHRKEVYNSVMTKVDMMDLNVKMKLHQSHSAALAANMTKFQGDIAGSHGYLVGNSQMGWFRNEMSFQGVLEGQQASQMAHDALNDGSQAETKRLYQMWWDVE